MEGKFFLSVAKHKYYSKTVPYHEHTINVPIQGWIQGL